MTIEAIKTASQEELNAVPQIDARTAESVFRYFHPEESGQASDSIELDQQA